MSSYTSKLNLKLIDEKEYFADEAFNAVINDADNKLIGVSHLSSAQHWDEWKPNKAYIIGDIVRYKALLGGQYVKCVVAGISGSSEPTNNVTGSNVKDGTVEWTVLSLADLLFDSTKIDIWLSSSNYKRGQVALYNNCLYRCKTPHTSSSSFDLDASYWQEVKASIGLWKPLVYYYTDDIVVNDGLIYKNNIAHVSDSTFSSTEEANWELISGAGGISSWQSSETYNEGQLVINDGIVYKVSSKHTSSSSFSADIANWDILNAGLNSWATSVYYPAGMIVIANNKLYQCITAHTSTKFTADEANWQEISGYRIVIDDWKANTEYVVGDLCANDKKIYRCTIKHTSGTLFDAVEEANWEELSPTINEINDWKSNTSYNAKDIVINDNALYRCKTAHTSTSDFATDALTYWVKLSGANAVSVWASSKSYDEGQLVVYNNQLFRANVSHASSATFDLDGAKWNLMESNIGEYKANVYYPIGTAVIYNNALFKCKVAHNSTSTFNGDNWTRIGNNNPLVKDWATSTYYYANDVVLYANQLYRCKTSHISSSFSADIANWDILNAGLNDWATSVYYPVGIVVLANNKIYQCKTAHTSTTFTADIANWKEISASEHSSGGGVTAGVSLFEFADNDIVNCGSLVRFNALPIVDTFDELTWDFSSAILDNTQTKYENNSLLCNSASKCYCICDDLLTQMFTSGFTIDFWAYITYTSDGGPIYIGTMDGVDQYQILEMYRTNEIYTQHILRGGVSYINDKWQYWSLNFYNNKLYIFIDGKLELSCDCLYNSNSSNGIYINAGRTYERHFKGYISDFKLTKYVKHTKINFTRPLDKPNGNISYSFSTNVIYRDTIDDLVILSKNDSNILSDLNMIALSK